MVTTWKSSLRDSIYNLYISEPRTSKNREEPKKKKKKLETEREARDPGRALAAHDVARCLGTAWISGLLARGLGCMRDPGRAPCVTRHATQATSRVAWVRPGSRARPSARPRPRRSDLNLSLSLSLSLSIIFWKFGMYERLWLKFYFLIFCL